MSRIDASNYAINGSVELARMSAQNNRRLVSLRWWYLTFVCLVALVSSYFVYKGQVYLIDYGLILLAGLVVNGLFYAAVRLRTDSLRSQQFITFAQLTFDLSVIGLVTYVQGGLEARVTILYAIPILAAALLFNARTVILTAVLSSATYVVAIILESYIANDVVEWSGLLVPIVFYPLVFLVVARIALYLQHFNTLRTREDSYNSFLSLVGHQLKHPASAVSTIVDALGHNDAAQLDKTTLHYIDLLKVENRNQIRLIDNLLESAPKNKLEKYTGTVDISKLVNKLATSVAEANERQADLRKMTSSQSSVWAKGSEIKLGLAVSNIFDNAFRYSEPGNLVQYRIQAKAQRVVITIHDGGSGMDQSQVLAQITRLDVDGIRGMSASGHLGGLGLGLYAAHRIIEHHGGQLDIHSSDKIGTTITIKLERSSADE